MIFEGKKMEALEHATRLHQFQFLLDVYKKLYRCL